MALRRLCLSMAATIQIMSAILLQPAQQTLTGEGFWIAITISITDVALQVIQSIAVPCSSSR